MSPRYSGGVSRHIDESSNCDEERNQAKESLQRESERILNDAINGANRYKDALNQAHEGEKPYKDALDQAHEGEKPYKDALDQAHEGEKPYKDALDQAHEGEKPYKDALDQAHKSDNNEAIETARDAYFNYLDTVVKLARDAYFNHLDTVVKSARDAYDDYVKEILDPAREQAREIDRQIGELNSASCDEIQKAADDSILQDLSQKAKGPGSLKELRERVKEACRSGIISKEEANDICKEAKERIRMPFSEELISSRQGMRNDPINKEQKQDHKGLDFGVPSETEVNAVAPGKVTQSYKSETFGETVILDHGTDADGNHIFTLYAHNKKRHVKAGDSVSQGSHIADSNNTGSRSNGNHLHFETRMTPSGKPNTPYYESDHKDPSDFIWPDLQQQ